MSNKRKTITISVHDDFSKQLREFARLVDKGQGELTDLQNTTQKGGAGFSNMAKNIDHATTALMNTWSIARSVVSTMTEMANEGAKIQQTAFSFDRLAGSSQEADKWIRAMQEASRGALTEYEATNQAIQLMTMGLADSAEEAGRFMEVAAITKAINPELGTMENTITNIGMTLANDSWMRLDQLGVDATKLKTRMKELEAQGIATTEAFDMGVMEQLEENAQTIGTEVLDIGKDTAAMQADWRELKDAASEFALIIMEEISPALTFILGQMTQFVQAWNFVLTEDSLFAGTFQTGADTPRLADDPNFVATQEAALEQFYAANGMVKNSDGEWEIGDPAILPVELALADPTVNDMMGMMLAHQGVTSTGMPAFSLPSNVGRGNAPMRSTPNISQQDIANMMLQRQNVTSTGALPFQPPTPIDQSFFDTAVMLGNDAAGLLDMSATDISNRSLPRMNQNVTSTGAMAFEGISITTTELANASAAFADNMERAVEAADAPEFTSLAQKFGTGGDAFDVSVLSAMRDALGDVTFSGDEAERAIANMELRIGEATGSSRVFESQLDTLSQGLADGTLTVGEYVQKVQDLSQVDFSQVDNIVSSLIDEGDIETAQQYIDAVGQIANFGGVSGGMTQEEANPWLAGVGLGGGEDEESPFQSLIDGVTEMEDAVTGSGEEMNKALTEDFDQLSSQGIEAFGGLKSSIIEDMGAALTFIEENVNGMTWTISSTVGVGDAPPQISTTNKPVGNSAPEFAEGGYTGRGSNPFMAWLHPNELVIPLDKMPLGGGGGGADTVKVDLYIDGRQVEASVNNVKRLKNERM